MRHYSEAPLKASYTFSKTGSINNTVESSRNEAAYPPTHVYTNYSTRKIIILLANEWEDETSLMYNAYYVLGYCECAHLLVFETAIGSYVFDTDSGIREGDLKSVTGKREAPEIRVYDGNFEARMRAVLGYRCRCTLIRGGNISQPKSAVYILFAIIFS